MHISKSETLWKGTCTVEKWLHNLKTVNQQKNPHIYVPYQPNCSLSWTHIKKSRKVTGTPETLLLTVCLTLLSLCFEENYLTTYANLVSHYFNYLNKRSEPGNTGPRSWPPATHTCAHMMLKIADNVMEEVSRFIWQFLSETSIYIQICLWNVPHWLTHFNIWSPIIWGRSWNL